MRKSLIVYVTICIFLLTLKSTEPELTLQLRKRIMQVKKSAEGLVKKKMTSSKKCIE